MDATELEENYPLTPTVLGHRATDLLRVATVPAVTAMSSLIVILAVEAAAAGAP
jgi:hypothetical protein